MLRQRIIVIILSAIGTGLLLAALALAVHTWLGQEIAAGEAELYLTYEWLPEPTIIPATATAPATSTPTPTPTSTPTPQPQPPTRVVIPAIHVNSAIREIGVVWDRDAVDPQLTWPNLRSGVGHDRDSASPGEAGNIILLGHNNTAGEVFRNLRNLTTGDVVQVYTADQRFSYLVKWMGTVRARAASVQDQRFHAFYLGPKTEETLTLVSCWPYSTYTHRVYVVAVPAGIRTD
jgi:LPXTG-site transpeptidase (sortase) family protein